MPEPITQPYNPDFKSSRSDLVIEIKGLMILLNEKLSGAETEHRFGKSGNRPSIDEYFMNIAEVIATRSTCVRLHVGAVIVRDKRIISTAYNGAPRSLEHCLDIGCIREHENIRSGTMVEVCRAVHAEQNAIIQAAIHGVSIDGATLYCTHQPCVLCAKMIINANIVRVVFKNSYPDPRALEFFAEAGVEVVEV